MKLLQVVLCLAVLSLVSSQAAATDQGQQETNSIGNFIQKEMRERKIPGLQVAIVQHGKVVFDGAYGLENVSTKAQVTIHSLFPINSISKAFTGVAVLQLVEAGKLRLDAPAAAYLPGLPPAWRQITLRQLLSHMSGLPELVNDNVELLGGKDEAGAWAEVQRLPVHFEPGSQFEYCQTNYAVLQKVIEKVSGMPFGQFIRRGQLSKAGMEATSVQGGTNLPSGMVPTYTYLHLILKGWETIGVQKTDHLMLRHEPMPYLIEAAGGIVSTADDLAKWIIALQSGAILKKRESLEALWAPQPLKSGAYVGLNDVANGYAAGWPIIMRRQHPAYAPEGGERAAMFVYPKDQLTVIVLTNLMGGSPQAFIDQIASFYMPETPAARGSRNPATGR